jgi:geranylgeranyl reductase family protein
MTLPGTEADVLVIGAGPAGSATAFWLATTGHRVVLLDRSDFPRDKACSEYLGPGAADLLQRLEVLEELRHLGASPLAGTTVIAARGARLTGRFALASSQRPGAIGLSVTRRVLDETLLRRAVAAGVEFCPRNTVEDLVVEQGFVRGAIVRDAEGRHQTFRARITVGADGLRSIVARRLGGVDYSRPRRMAFVAHMQDVRDISTTSEMHVGPRGYVGLNYLGGDLTNVALVVPADDARAAAGQPEEFFLAALEAFPGVRGRVARNRIARPVMATGPFSAKARHVMADGALLVGDAADFFDPFTGEGIYTALRGAELAASVANEALRHPGPVTARNLSPYSRARRKAFLGKWAVERLIGYGMLAPALFDRAVSRLGRRGKMAHTLIGVTADFLPASRVLNPLFLSRMMI